MAGKVVDVDELMNTVLVCDICTEPFNASHRIPLLLPCRHSFCTPCLETYSKGGNFNCPTCRHVVILSGPVAAALPRDIISLKVVDYLAMKAAPKAIPCQDCPDNGTAHFRCLTCGLSMCEECRRAHVRVPLSRNHQVRAISELLASPRDLLQEVEMCSRHPGSPLNLYCSSPACRTALCTTCAMVGHHQNNHVVEELSEAYKKAEAEISGLKTSLQQQEMNCQDAFAELSGKLQDVETSTAKAIENINAGVDAIKKALEHRRLELLQQVQSIKDQHQAAIHENRRSIQGCLEEVQGTVKFLKRAESLARPAELLTVLQEQVSGVGQLLQTPLPQVFPSHPPQQAHDNKMFDNPNAQSNILASLAQSSFQHGFGLRCQRGPFQLGAAPHQGNAGSDGKTSVCFDTRNQQLLAAVQTFGTVSNLWSS